MADEFKGIPESEIIRALDGRGVKLEIAIENLERDFNMGTIVRSANAFGVRKVHVIGRKQWNKRGAMMTDKYLEVIYHSSVAEFRASERGRKIIAIDNVEGSVDIRALNKDQNAILVFGSEASGLSDGLRSLAANVAHIPQLGSTRSLNVGVAAGIAMWEWLR